MTDDEARAREIVGEYEYADWRDDYTATKQAAIQAITAALADARRADEAEQEGISDKPCEVVSRPDGSRFCAAHQEAFIPTCSRGLASYGRRMRRQRDALAEALREIERGAVGDDPMPEASGGDRAQEEPR